MKNGFTLVEMIGVVTILAVIMLISAIPITKVLKDMDEKSFNSQLEQVVQAARLWGQDYPERLPANEIDITFVTMQELQNSGYLEDEIKNPKTKEPFKNMKLSIKKRGSKRFIYEIVEIDDEPYQSQMYNYEDD